MAFTEFCAKSGGSNLNAGTRTGNSTEPGTSADFTYASGNWVQSTGVFTVASGNPQSDGVAVGDFASVYPDGSSVAVFIGRVTARDSTTITVSLTAKSGTAPTNGTGDRTLKIGGAWAGPNGTSGFPFNFVENTMKNVAGDYPRINFKNAAQFDITAAMTHTLNGPVRWQGYSSAYGDGGKATIDGGTSGASYVPLTVSGVDHVLVDLIVAHNGASGSADGFNLSSGRNQAIRCVVHDVRGSGLTSGLFVECEAYACNASNTSNKAGLVGSATSTLLRCIAHDNAGSNTAGFYSQGTGTGFVACISDSNGGHGFNLNNLAAASLIACDAYNNGGSGIRKQGATAANLVIQNCNLVKNGAYGIDLSGASESNEGILFNCGYGSGTQANTSGDVNSLGAVEQVGAVTYSNDVTPWADPDNGDFRTDLAEAKGTGRGAFTQTAAGYAGTVGYPDIGAAQHQDSGGGGGLATPLFGGGVI